jgi:hypothetical protein
MMRYASLLFLLALPCAAEEPPLAFPGVKPRGPQVEVMLRDGKGHSPFFCFLTGYKDGVVNLQMLAGESRQERMDEVVSIRFIEMPPAPEPERRPALSDDSRRLKELMEKDSAASLTPEEVDEVFALREKAPIFPGDPGPIERRALAKKIAQREENKGRLDRHIALNQKRLKKVDNEEDARDLLVMLEVAYFQKRPLPAKVREQLKEDIKSIANESVRRRVENFGDNLEFPRPFRKDK